MNNLLPILAMVPLVVALAAVAALLQGRTREETVIAFWVNLTLLSAVCLFIWGVSKL